MLVNSLIDHLDDVEMGMRLYQLNNRPFRKQDLQRLTRIISLQIITIGEVRVGEEQPHGSFLFHLFLKFYFHK